MLNYRPLQKQYQQKRTVKRPIKICVIDSIESVNIANHNICDLDKYDSKIKRGPSGGGGMQEQVEELFASAIMYETESKVKYLKIKDSLEESKNE